MLDRSRKTQRPPFDPELADIVGKIRFSVDAPLTLEKIAKARLASCRNRMTLEEIRHYGFEATALRVPQSDAALTLLNCQAKNTPEGMIYHVHGGGMVAGHHRSFELGFDLARAGVFNLCVMSPKYRLAPENSDLVPLEDCYEGLCFASSSLPPGVPIVLSGNSAGGGLVAGLMLMARDKGGPNIAGVMMQCPMLDDACTSFSHRQFETNGVWDGLSNRLGWTALLGSKRSGENVSPYVAPARETDLSNLPPLFIDVGSSEALREEAIQFSIRVWNQGGRCDLHVWDGAFHSFDQWMPDAAVSISAESVRRSWLKRVLSRGDVYA